MLDILAFGTATLGLFLALPLLASRRQRAANAWLGGFVLALAMLSVASTHDYRQHPTWFGLLDWPVTTLGACFYLYVREMVGLRNGLKQALHFLPLVVFVVVLAWCRLVLGQSQLPMAFSVFLMVCQALAAVYAALSLYRLHHYRQALRLNYSSLQDRDLNWLVWLSLVAISLLVVWVPATRVLGLWEWVLALGRLGMLYFIGWFGLRQTMVLLPKLTDTAPPAPPAPDEPPPASADGKPTGTDALPDPAEAGKYARSGLTQAAQALIQARLTRRMSHDRDFLENDLTLSQLAERIGTSPQLLSQVLNDSLKLSFFDYVNGLRVAEVQRLMAEPAHSGATLLDLAFAAGFSSKSTFNAAFRQRTGTTPSQWRRQTAPAPGATGGSRARPASDPKGSLSTHEAARPSGQTGP